MQMWRDLRQCSTICALAYHQMIELSPRQDCIYQQYHTPDILSYPSPQITASYTGRQCLSFRQDRANNVLRLASWEKLVSEFSKDRRTQVTKSFRALT